MRATVRKLLGGSPHLLRYGETEAIGRYLDGLDTAAMDGAGITDGPQGRAWRSWTEYSSPEFDLCAPPADLPTFDLVMCQHVLEHVLDPIAATRTLHRMLRPDGHLILVTPFLVKIHNDPVDLWRFTPEGMHRLLDHAGFTAIDVGAWGNAFAVAANLRIFIRRQRWMPLHNNPTTPAAVWAFARG